MRDLQFTGWLLQQKKRWNLLVGYKHSGVNFNLCSRTIFAYFNEL
jgi:hypothetical protein